MASRFKTRCPHCKSNIAYEAEHAGKPAKCPTCKGEVQIPKIPPVVPGLVASGSHSSPVIGARFRRCFQASDAPFRRGRHGDLPSAIRWIPKLQPCMGSGRRGPSPGDLRFAWCSPLCRGSPFGEGRRTLITLIGREGEEGLQKAKFLDHLEVVVSMSVLVVILLGVLFVSQLRCMEKKSPLREVLFTTGLILLPLVGLALYGLGLSFFKIKSGRRDGSDRLRPPPSPRF